MTRAAKEHNKPIKSERQLSEWLEQGCTKPDELRIGVEHEKFLYNEKDFSPVAYDADSVAGKKGIRDLFTQLASRYGWQSGYEDGNVIMLEKDNVAWTLEPGGQVETGGAPLKDVHQIAQETQSLLQQSDAVAKDLDMNMLGVGFHPTGLYDTAPNMPMSRHKFLRDYLDNRKFPNTRDIWWTTATVQVNLGFESESDMVKKLRVALSLQPLVVAMFANSPFREGKPNGYQSYRSHIIHNAAGGRYGFMLPVAFEEGFGFERYADYALNEMPLLGVYKDSQFVDAHEAKFKEFMEAKLDICPDQKPTMNDWSNHLNTIWPEVRLRRCLEMRGADSGPPEMVTGLAAFWTGILYDKQALDEAYELVRYWTHEDRSYLRTMTPLQGLETPFLNNTTTVQEMAKQCLSLAEAGLKRRGVKNGNKQDESFYLEPLKEIVESGRNLATRQLDKYKDEWKGDINRLFEEYNCRANPSVIVDSKGRPFEQVSAPAAAKRKRANQNTGKVAAKKPKQG